jgi:hypothetical protein
MNKDEILKYAEDEKRMLRLQCPDWTEEEIEDSVQAFVKQAKAINGIED